MTYVVVAVTEAFDVDARLRAAFASAGMKVEHHERNLVRLTGRVSADTPAAAIESMRTRLGELIPDVGPYLLTAGPAG